MFFKYEIFHSFILEIMNKMMGYDFGKNLVFNKAKAQVMKASGGHYPAPLKILEVILSFQIKVLIT
jgi:enoyl-CoA hydratase/long-chain 3-hydroxyacyl-CoA dehydrogenase